MRSLAQARYCEVEVLPVVFILDAPAHAFATQTVGHNATKPCGKCEITGKHQSGRMCYTSMKNKKRTDVEFRLRTDKKHHVDYRYHSEMDETNDSGDIIVRGPLELIEGVDMVHSFPPDYLHVICLGVVKKNVVDNH